MSPMSGNMDLELDLDLEESSETSSQPLAIHEYAVGIISSDSKGRSSVVSISELHKIPASFGSSPDNEAELLTSGFQSWSMSSYQSLYHSSGFHEEDENENGDDEFKEDANNNMAPTGSVARGGSGGPSLKTSSSSGTLVRLSSSPKKIPCGSARRRWSTSSIFGGKSASPPQARVLPWDPDMPSSVSPPESWFSSLTQIPDKIRQHRADKNRFDVSSVSREQLKKLHCY